MKLKVLAMVCVLLLSGCKASKQQPLNEEVITLIENKEPVDQKVIEIIDFAKQFEGVRYKYGGTTKRGMDCSGLIYTSFKENDIPLPRTTEALATAGDWVDVKTVREGDLLFFATKKNSRRVNHVGLVTNTRTGQIEFIHASTSSGVIISSLAERYWYFAFVQARRIM